jgi:hypothetical protein
MRQLTALLERFKNSLGRDTISREMVASCIEELTGIRVLPEQMSLKEGVLSLNISPVKKNEIKLKEQMILDALWNLHKIKIGRVFYN